MNRTILPTPEEVNRINQILKKHQNSFYPVMGEKFPEDQFCLIDLTEKNTRLSLLAFHKTEVLNSYIFDYLQENRALAGVGGYLENRIIYTRSEVFSGTECRSIHLGVDLWAPAFTTIYAPLDGTIYCIKDNQGFGDYGPTIILEHRLEEVRFYTLYGHLSRRSLEGLEQGQLISKGTPFTELGPAPENGDWPPHLHFQIIQDLEGNRGDYPGVAAPSASSKYQANCPDPNLILNLKVLQFGKQPGRALED